MFNLVTFIFHLNDGCFIKKKTWSYFLFKEEVLSISMKLAPKLTDHLSSNTFRRRRKVKVHLWSSVSITWSNMSLIKLAPSSPGLWL
jgi:hypothetical protein